MNEDKVIDARGLSCPEPVLLTHAALDEYGNEAFSVVVSSPTARDNVQFTLRTAGRRFNVQEDDGEWMIEVQTQ